MTSSPLLLISLILSYPFQLVCQQPADPSARYYRMICLVNMVGSGTHRDPLRPEFVPQSAAEAEKAGIVAWTVMPTDDKRQAILHIVAKDRRAFDAIRGSKKPEVKAFDLDKGAKDGIETEMKRVKRDFDLTKFEVIAR